MLHEVEQGGLGPVDVVEDEDDRTFPSPRLQEAAHRPGGLLRAARARQAEQAAESLGDRRGVGPLPRGGRADGCRDVVWPRELRQPEGRPQRLGEGQPGDALAVREAPAAQHLGRVPQRSQELLDEPALAGPRDPEHREQAAGAPLDDSAVRAGEQRGLPVAPDHRRVEPSGPGRRAGGKREDAPGGDGLRLPLGGERRRGLGSDRVPHQPPRRLAHEHLARRRARLEPRRGVHRVADEGPAAARDQHLAGGDPDARLERDRRALAQARQPLLDLQPRADRPQGVVLVDRGHPEHRAHRVADELLDAAAVPLDRLPRLGEVPLEQGTQHLRVVALAERRRSDEVAEQHRHDLPRLVGGSGRPQLCPAVRAEGGVRGAAPAAGRTGQRRHCAPRRNRSFRSIRRSIEASGVVGGLPLRHESPASPGCLPQR